MPTSSAEPSTSGSGWIRWAICALLFLATTINYIDRAVLGVLEPVLQKQTGWSATEYGNVNAAFSAAYALGFLFAGWLIDRVGTRVGYTLFLIVWSLAAAGHALVESTLGFAMARFALGLGESGNFPAAIKTVAEWFPKRERAFATGIFNSGSNVGAILAPALVPLLYAKYGWQAAFIATGLVGLLWVFLWWPFYRTPRQHPLLSPAELNHIESDPSDPPIRISWAQLLPYPQTWAFAIGKFLTDSIWWFYLFWFPKFMNEQFQVDIKSIGLPMITVYLLADIGSIAGGWQSSWLLKRGATPNFARKLAMLTCALCIVPVAAAPLVSSKWLAVLLVGVAAAAHQGFSANLFTLTSDMFPRKVVGSVVGIGGFAGALGGLIMNFSAGRLRDMFGNYIVIFTVAACAYLVALAVIHILAPRLEPVKFSEE